MQEPKLALTAHNEDLPQEMITGLTPSGSLCLSEGALLSVAYVMRHEKSAL